MKPLRIGLVGAGAIGRAHARLIAAEATCTLAAIADTAPAAASFAAGLGAPHFPTPEAMLDAGGLDAVIVASPNHLHLPHATAALARGLPVLVEKPVAATVAEGLTLAEAAEQAGVPVLVGHHRRHNPILATARRLVAEGRLGALAAVTILAAFAKPEAYFDLAWRREPGAGGPVLINLIHEIDLIRFVCGEIADIHALTGNAQRGFAVEDSAAVALRLQSGALATITLSDAAASPWSWDLASGESPNYPPQPARLPTHMLCGTQASLALPTLELWHYDATPDWFAPIRRADVAAPPGNPYEIQLRHFRDVAAATAAPLVGVRDATRTLLATLAVHESAATGQKVVLAGA